MYLSNLMRQLWENPQIVSILLLNSSIDDIKDNLADLFVNNFFENIISSNCIENNLLYVITFLLKDEINNLKDVNSTEIFLNSTRCGYLLERLIDKKDLKIFFKNIIIEVIENINNFYLNEELTFNANKLNEKAIKKNNNIYNFEKSKKDNDSEIKKENIEHLKLLFQKDDISIESNKEKEDEKMFKNKYIKSLKEEDLKMFLSEYEKKEKNNNIKDFINDISNSIKSSSNLYNTEIFSKNINNDISLNLYKIYYFKISEYLDIILDNLLKNLDILPYPIKCICKIISILLEKQFPNIQNFQKNAFISKFIFYNLFSSMFLNPGNIALINDFIDSKTQENNLSIILDIIKRFVIGKLFKDDNIEGNYTPFNWLFIEKMPKLIEFIKNLTNIKLPNFIEELITGGTNKEYKYDYFKENKNEIICHSSICFSTDDLYILIKNIQNCKEKLFIDKDLEKTIQKLFYKDHLKKIYNLSKKKGIIDDEKCINELNIDRKIQIGKKQKISGENTSYSTISTDKEYEKELNFFLITNLFINNENKNLFDLSNKDLYFMESEEKNDKSDINEIEQIEKIINKMKNYLYIILYNYKILNKDDFDDNKILNISNILEQMKKHMKSLNILIDNKSPSDWYIDTILELFKKFPEEYFKNDGENF